MANTYFPNQFQYTKERMVCELYAVLTIGSTGAVTLTRGKGITSATKDSTGQYTLLLQSNYNALLGVDILPFPGTSAPAAPLMVLEAEQVSSASAPSITIQCRAIDNSTVTNPGSGEKILVKITLTNSSV